VLDCFNLENSAWSLAELSARLDLPKSTLHRFLVGLELNGILRRDAMTGNGGWAIACSSGAAWPRKAMGSGTSPVPSLHDLTGNTGETNPTHGLSPLRSHLHREGRDQLSCASEPGDWHAPAVPCGGFLESADGLFAGSGDRRHHPGQRLAQSCARTRSRTPPSSKPSSTRCGRRGTRSAWKRPTGRLGRGRADPRFGEATWWGRWALPAPRSGMMPPGYKNMPGCAARRPTTYQPC